LALPVANGCAVEDQPMPLIIVGPSIVLPDIEIIDRRAEEEFPTLSSAFE
jgi:hypothetical protein